jgi:2-polyprenyl-6-methoxyphenol hydroxylase-like FAD-dependent oxidoreductase
MTEKRKRLVQKNGSAIVVGASLSGLMTGIALSQVGMNVTILERAGRNRETGAALQVDNGERDRSPTANLLRRLASGGDQDVEAWSSVERRLRAEAEADLNIDLRFGTRIQAIGQDEHSAWAVTTNGDTIHGDILVGADGHRSIVRGHVAPHKPDATFAGYLIWVGIVDEADIPEAYRPHTTPPLTMPNGIGDFMLGFFLAGIDGSWTRGRRRLGWAWYDNTQNALLRRLGCVEGSVVQHSLHPADIPDETLLELAEKAAVRWSQPWLAAIIHCIQTQKLVGTPIAEYVPDKLVNGRVALVGDAAHVPTPLTASGFNSALQDAATLAECVEMCKQGTAAVEALMRYEARRLVPARETVEAGQGFSRSFGRR